MCVLHSRQCLKPRIYRLARPPKMPKTHSCVSRNGSLRTIPESLSTPAGPAANQKPISANIQGKFLRGPVPLDWLLQAAKLPGRAFHVDVALWCLDGFNRTRTVQLKPSVIRELGMDRHASYRSLDKLEAAGLLSVVHKRGAAPMLTLHASVSTVRQQVYRFSAVLPRRSSRRIRDR